MSKHIISLILVSAVFFAVSCKGKVEETPLMKQAKGVIQPLPEKMPGAEKDTAERIALGKALYMDNRLSVNDSQSCNTCHRLDNKLGGVDNEKFSPGAHKEMGGRNAPTVLNAGFQLAQFWDGRAKDLQEQAKGPVLNSVEMAMPSPEAVVKKISEVKEYQEMFKKAFPDEKDPLTYDNLAEAIAAFERTLVTHDRFDDYLKGNDSALNDEEKVGLELFMAKGCTACHNGPAIGGQTYQKLGAVNPYSNTKDMGRFDVTKKEEDKFFFKVPVLRNIALTAPYFHDGGVATLEEAVTQMAWLQLGQKLTEEETKKIVAFLNTLTDKERK
jgi:cytochrome c peroxidase